MLSHTTAAADRPIPPFHAAPSQPSNYCPIPQRLITDVHDNPLAIGVYTLIGRLYFVVQTAIPLSVPDVLRYDPTLSRGAVIRALKRLVDGGWLLATTQRGHKTRYVPTWGRIKGTVQPWHIGQPCMGRPRHINRLPLDRTLLDVCMGKLTTHPVETASITRYITTPALSLADIGCYALTLAGLPHETPALCWLGLIRDGQARPLPQDDRLLATISQRPLTLDKSDELPDTELTMSGTRRLGVVPLASQSDMNSCSQPLFFVPPRLIGSLIPPLIGSMIGSGAVRDPSPIPSASRETRSDVRPNGITWESRESRDQGTTPPNPPQPQRGGGTEQQLAKGDGPAREERPDTETASALRAINVRPHIVTELADQPLELVRAAINNGRSRPDVRDLAGWVVALVRDARDHGWRVLCAGDRTALDDADRQASFARAKAVGLFVADDTVEDMLPVAGQDQVAASDAGQAEMPAEVSPLEDLTKQLQQELRARTYPDLHPIIAGLTAHDDGMTLTLRCANSTHLAVVRARLLPLIGPVLHELGCSRDLRLAAVAYTAPPSATKKECAVDRRARADELISRKLG